MNAVLLASAPLALWWAAVEPDILTVATNDDSGSGSLRAAVAASASGNLIFDPAVKNPIVRTSGQIAITHAQTIAGPRLAKPTAAEIDIRATRWRH